MQNQFVIEIFFALASGGLKVHAFAIEHTRCLQWTRQHADEMARQFTGRTDYVALQVRAGNI